MSQASTTVYLYLGLDEQRRKSGGAWPNEGCGSHFELVDWVEGFAVVLEELYTNSYSSLDLGCVFDYEIAEDLGAWLYSHPQATNHEFKVEADRLVALQVEEDKKHCALWAQND